MNLQKEVREDRDKTRNGKLSKKKFLEKWEREIKGRIITGKMKKSDVQKIKKGRKPTEKALTKKIKREK